MGGCNSKDQHRAYARSSDVSIVRLHVSNKIEGIWNSKQGEKYIEKTTNVYEKNIRLIEYSITRMKLMTDAYDKLGRS